MISFSASPTRRLRPFFSIVALGLLSTSFGNSEEFPSSDLAHPPAHLVRFEFVIEGLSVEEGTTKFRLNESGIVHCPSIVLRVDGTPAMMEIIRERPSIATPNQMPFQGVKIAVVAEKDPDTGKVSHSGNATISIKRASDNGTASFDIGQTLWERATLAPFTTSVTVTDGKELTLTVTTTEIDASGNPYSGSKSSADE